MLTYPYVFIFTSKVYPHEYNNQTILTLNRIFLGSII